MPALAANRRFLISCMVACASMSAAEPQRIAVRKDGFVLIPSGAPFTPWGFNYDRDYRHRLLEDYWSAEFPSVERHFREMKSLGANVVRLHLQFAQFMDSPTQPNQSNLARLQRLIRVAEVAGLYLDITGLGSYRAADIPAWYSMLPEPAHWAAQAAFWDAVSGACANLPGVFAYNLMNEPVVSEDRRPPGTWIHPNVLGSLHYVEFINLDPAGRQRSGIAKQWIRQMVQTIRRRDPQRPITVGIMSAGFEPAKIAPEVDYISVHLYPEKGKTDAAMDALKRCKTAQPLVIEETYPLKCGVADLGEFITRSRTLASGWLGFYWGQTPEELKGSAIPADQRAYQWLNLFQSMNPNHI